MITGRRDWWDPRLADQVSIGNIAKIELVSSANGKPVYIVAPEPDSGYDIGETQDGIKTMTVNAGVSDFKYFTVNINPVVAHSGNETVVFTHLRNGSQLQINSTRADFDQVDLLPRLVSIFCRRRNPKAGYIVDERQMLKTVTLLFRNNVVTGHLIKR